VTDGELEGGCNWAMWFERSDEMCLRGRPFAWQPLATLRVKGTPPGGVGKLLKLEEIGWWRASAGKKGVSREPEAISHKPLVLSRIGRERVIGIIIVVFIVVEEGGDEAVFEVVKAPSIRTYPR
jgi:hypothetical protein